MKIELLIFIFAVLIGGFALSGGALVASYKKSYDKCSEACGGFGVLAFLMFAGTLIATSVLLYNLGAFR